MKRQKENLIYTFLLGAAALFIFSVATFLGISIFEEYVGIVIGVALMLVALLFHNIAKRQISPYIISYLLNTVACGFSASSYYTAVETHPNLGEFIAATLPVILLLFICATVFCFTQTIFNGVLTIFCVLDIALALFAGYNWIAEGDAFWSFLCFSSIVALFYIIALKSIASNSVKFRRKGAFLRIVSFYSFGIFIVVTLIVLAILSEGDSLDGLDALVLGDTVSGTKDDKKEKKKQ
ncbi:MAG: hypothetical protein IJX55_07855 [Clostridia bacterium]|nr:hypothetical protein [Clostridia bacterium]